MVVAYSNGSRLPDFGSVGGGGVSSIVTSQQIVSTDSNFAATTRNIAISSVTQANVWIKVEIQVGGGNGAFRDDCSFRLTSSTNLRLTKSSASNGSTQFLVKILELDPASFTSNQFISDTNTTSSGFTDIAITSVNTSKAVAYPHYYSNSNTAVSRNTAAVDLTSSTNARYWHAQPSGTHTFGMEFQVIEWI